MYTNWPEDAAGFANGDARIAKVGHNTDRYSAEKVRSRELLRRNN
jgi:hypothetical protein